MAASSARQDQSAVIAFMKDPATHGGLAVTSTQTHGAIVFFAGQTAYKMKKAVKYSYMDFSTLALRKAVCARELELNRRTAPAIYRRVLPVTDEGGGKLALDGKGTPVEWLIEMQRFDEDGLLDRVITREGASRSLMLELAETVADFHGSAERKPDFGGADGIAAIITNNGRELEALPDLFGTQKTDALTRESLAMVEASRALLDARRDKGFVRRCHGDLHPGNIVLIEDHPVLFDCIEFSDAFACIDVLYDLAFLLMELLHADEHQRPMLEAANAVFNGYLAAIPHDELADDLDALALMPLFLSMRACVRAHVNGRMAVSADDPAEKKAFARHYFAEMETYLRDPGPSLTAVGGLSGTGKSVLAAGIASDIGAPPGAVVLRTDAIRKALAGVEAGERLPREAYTKEASGHVYGEMLSLARRALGAGHAVVLDAVFAREEEREMASRLARDFGVPFHGLWLEAPADVLRTRVTARRGDVSDADAAVVEKQLTYDLGTMRWARVDSSGTPEQSLARARDALIHG